MKTNIHDAVEICPEIRVTNDGRGWLSFYIRREGWFDSEKMETVEVTIFTDDIAKLSCDLSEALREGISQMNDDMAEKELAV